MRILIVDDHPLMRFALRATLEDIPGWSVAGEARTGREAVELHRRLRPEVTIMDLLLPGELDGPAATRAILAEAPQARILAFSSQGSAEQIRAALQAGAVGYLDKGAERDRLQEALDAVLAGFTYLPPAAAELIAHGPQSAAGLSAREQEILTLLGEGVSTEAIAQRLFVSESTVRTHISHLRLKLGLATRAEMIAYAAQRR